MHVPARPSRYRAYLLRCWEEGEQGTGRGKVWRFSLEDAYTSQRRGFASLEEMMAFLRSQLEGEADPPPRPVSIESI